MKTTNIILLTTIMLLAHMSMKAQLGDPREKFGITAEIDGTTNVSHTWKSTNDDALASGTVNHGVNVKLNANMRLLKVKNLTVALSPFYNFSNERIDNNWGEDESLDILERIQHINDHFGLVVRDGLTHGYRQFLRMNPLGDGQM